MYEFEVPRGADPVGGVEVWNGNGGAGRLAAIAAATSRSRRSMRLAADARDARLYQGGFLGVDAPSVGMEKSVHWRLNRG